MSLARGNVALAFTFPAAKPKTARWKTQLRRKTPAQMSSALHRLSVESIFATVGDRSLQSNDFEQSHVRYSSQSKGSDKHAHVGHIQASFSSDSPPRHFCSTGKFRLQSRHDFHLGVGESATAGNCGLRTGKTDRGNSARTRHRAGHNHQARIKRESTRPFSKSVLPFCRVAAGISAIRRGTTACAAGATRPINASNRIVVFMK